jgi:arabinogalactan endo-1,4-beta-galactosidase
MEKADKSLREMVIQTIADDSAYWEFDFDRDEYNVPNNWEEMSMEEKAEYVYSHTAWTLEDWLKYYQFEFE